MSELHRTYGMRRVQFITEEQISDFYIKASWRRRDDYVEVFRIISSLLLDDEAEGRPAVIKETPCPTLTSQWLTALGAHGSNDLPPTWRTPIIFVPEMRSGEWPNQDIDGRELKYKIDDRTEINSRNLVSLERYEEHRNFEPDLDPWRYGATGRPPETVGGAVDERREALRRLPRPPEDILPLHLTFSEIVQRLERRLDWTCGRPGRVYYIPPEGWDPRTKYREEWRSGDVFPKGFVKKEDGSRYYGPIDREKRIWLWDLKENHHWDVQLPNGKHLNVSHDGIARELD